MKDLFRRGIRITLTPDAVSPVGGNAMGLIHADLEMRNGADMAALRTGEREGRDVRSVRVRAQVDTGAYSMCINEVIRHELGLPTVDRGLAELADGTIVEFDVVGPLEVCFRTRTTICTAAVLPGESEPLLGSIPLEDMDVVLNPKEQRIDLPPDRPHLARRKLKAAG